MRTLGFSHLLLFVCLFVCLFVVCLFVCLLHGYLLDIVAILL